MSLSEADHLEMREVFLEEMSELIQEIEKDLLALASTPQEMALVDRLFRNLHTIKGGAGIVEMEALARYTHLVENMLDKVRNGGIIVSSVVITLLLDALDCLKNFLDVALGTAVLGQAQLENTSQRIAVTLGEKMTPVMSPLAISAPPLDPVLAPVSDQRHVHIIQIQAQPQRFPSLPELEKVTDGLRQLGTLLVISHAHSLPPEAKRQPDMFYLWCSMHLTSAAEPARILDVLGDWPTQHRVEIMQLDLLPEAPENQAQVDAAVDGEHSVLPLPPPPLPPVSADKETNDFRSSQKLGSIRVDTGKLDKLVNLVGELVTIGARLDSYQALMEERDPELAEGLMEILDNSSRIVRELQDQAMTIRMVPIGGTFDAMQRLVHDYCGKIGKQMRLVILGHDTEVDKKVAEQISGPLKHLIRNALDHGMEFPDERVAKGKPPVGQITLSAYHQYGLIIIEVMDDGRGIQVERVIQSAKLKGLIDGNRELSEREGLELIFAPSVSTAACVTEISGRGVGMDVVKRDIEALRGSIEVSSAPDKGTTITVRIPMTLSILDGLLVCVGDNRYIIPLSSVEECVELGADFHLNQGSNFLDIRGELVPFLRLRELFDVPDEPSPFEKVVIVSSGDRSIGLVVDRLLGNHQTVIKGLSPLHRDVQCFMGATILGDGRVVLILDVLHLIEFGQRREDRYRAQERIKDP